MTKICRHAYVSGRVQGVWYRAFVREQAQAQQVLGWARNLADGRVEVMLCGDRGAVANVEAKLREGPPLARVTQVDAEDHAIEEFSTFTIS